MKRHVAEAMKQDDPPIWAKALDNAFQRLARLTNARKIKQERQRHRAGDQGHPDRTRPRRPADGDVAVRDDAEAGRCHGQHGAHQPDTGWRVAVPGRQGLPRSARRTEGEQGRADEHPPSAVESQQAKNGSRRPIRSRRRSSSIRSCATSCGRCWRRTSHSRRRSRTKTRLKGRIKKGEQVIRALGKTQAPRDPDSAKYTTEETDEQALDRWETIVNEADKSLTDAGMTQIGKNFNSASPIEMNMLVLLSGRSKRS